MKKNLIPLFLGRVFVTSCSPIGSPIPPSPTITSAKNQIPSQTIPATATPFPTGTSLLTVTLSPTRTPSPTASPLLPTPTIGVKEDTATQITIIYDNYLWDQRLTPEWGFAALVEIGAHSILFDTGATGDAFLNNLSLLDIDPKTIEAVVISHAHGDHFGGLLAFLEIANHPRVYLPSTFSFSFKERVSINADLVEVSTPIEIAPDIYSTGILNAGGIDEQGLVIDMGSELVILTGCAHPGIVRMVRSGIRTAAAQGGVATKPVALVAGGFHLMSARRSQVEAIITDLRDSGVLQISPTHCTGDAAIAIFAENLGDDYLPGGAGRIFKFP